jgi:small-conductance mechanosensitive channel
MIRMKFDVGKAVFVLIIIVGLAECARILGMDPYSITVFNHIVYTVTMVVLCFMILIGARLILIKILGWIDNSTDDGSKSSVFPILSVMMELVVILSFTYLIMDNFGVDLLVIITSLGIVGLAISFGAQSTLQQFFSGFAIMLTRSLKTGDVVRLRDNDTRLIVQSIGMMTTTFMSMENAEIIIMPNDVVAQTVVRNMTADDKGYCIELIMHFKVDSRDLDRVSEVLTKAAYGIDHIVTDGSFIKPTVLFMEFNQDGVKTKLLAYVDDVHYYDYVVSDLIVSVTAALRENDILPNGGPDFFIRNENKMNGSDFRTEAVR